MTTPETTNPVEPNPAKTKWSKKTEAIIGTTLLAIVVFFGLAIAGVFGKEEPEPVPAIERVASICEAEVTEALKAPSTAEFGIPNVSQTGNQYTVTGSVDAENSFGAMLTSTYRCAITDTSDGWNIESVDVT